MQKPRFIRYLQTSCPMSSADKICQKWFMSLISFQRWSIMRIPKTCYRKYCTQPSLVSIFFKCVWGKYLISGEEANVSLACLHITGSHTSYLTSLSSLPGDTEVIWEIGSHGEGLSPHHKWISSSCPQTEQQKPSLISFWRQILKCKNHRILKYGLQASSQLFWGQISKGRRQANVTG